MAGEDDYLLPARLAYHILHAADLYATSLGCEAYKPHRTYTLNWERALPDMLPTRETTLAFVAQTEAKVRAWIEALGDDGLLQAQDDYKWTGKTPLGRALYTLRHSQNHIGEINAELRRRGLPGGRW